VATQLNTLDFLQQGALLQQANGLFILFSGNPQPLTCSLEEALSDENQFLVYKPQFWSFLSPSLKISDFMSTYTSHNVYTREQLLDILLKHEAKTENLVISESQKLALHNDHKEHFTEQFEWSQRKFADLSLKKTVPITRFQYKLMQSLDLRRALIKALSNPTFGFLYGSWSQDSGFLGLTPEVLSSWEHKKLHTMALAGTWSFPTVFSTPESVDTKTQQEHQFVVDDICSRLEGKAQKGSMSIMELPTLNHLKTEIQCECDNALSFLEYARALHPTAALGVFPREKKLMHEFSMLNLHRDRRYFGAPFGIVNKKFAHLVVSIRNFSWQISSQTLDIFVGCGVTSRSHLNLEWQELHNKKNSVLKAFQFEEQTI
jgi:menaquinone-specific isochorismate synthase